MKARCFFLFTVLLAGASFTRSVSPYATLHIDDDALYLGEVFTIDVLLGAEEAPQFQGIAATNPIHVTTLASYPRPNGTNVWHYRFAARAKQSGELYLPPLPFSTGAQTLFTPARTLQVGKPERGEKMALRSSLSTNRVYQGQPLSLHTVWESEIPFNHFSAVDLHVPFLNLSSMEVLDPYEPDKEKQEDATGLPVHGTRVLATRQTEERGGRQLQTLRFEKRLIPKASGLIRLPASILLCAADQDPKPRSGSSGFQYPPYFNNTLFERNLKDGNYDRLFCESDELIVEVLPLPKEGRPTDFFGLVGDFQLEVHAAPLALPLGETVRLRIRIRSADGVEHLRFPDLSSQTALLRSFQPVADRSLPALEGEQATFEQSLRVVDPSVSEIPALRLSFFDPVSGLYRSIHSDPIPIQVLSDVPVPENNPVSEDAPVRPRWIRPVWTRQELGQMLALFLGGAVWLGLRILLRLPRVQKRSACFLFRFRLCLLRKRPATKRRIYRALDQEIRRYLGIQLDRKPGSLSYGEILRQLESIKLPKEQSEALADLFERCDAYRFTQGFDEEVDPGALLREGKRRMQGLDQRFKAARRNA